MEPVVKPAMKNVAEQDTSVDEDPSIENKLEENKTAVYNLDLTEGSLEFIRA